MKPPPDFSIQTMRSSKNSTASASCCTSSVLPLRHTTEKASLAVSRQTSSPKQDNSSPSLPSCSMASGSGRQKLSTHSTSWKSTAETFARGNSSIEAANYWQHSRLPRPARYQLHAGDCLGSIGQKKQCKKCDVTV